MVFLSILFIKGVVMDKFSADFVLCNFRYLVGGNELAARISQRQQTLSIAIAVYSGLLVAMITSKELFKSGAVGINLLLLGFVFAGVAITLLNYKYEVGLAVSRSYLADLERAGGAADHLPSYNAGQYSSRAHSARGSHGIVSALLILAYNSIGIGIFASESSLSGNTVIIVSSLLAAAAVACAVVNLRLNSITR